MSTGPFPRRQSLPAHHTAGATGSAPHFQSGLIADDEFSPLSVAISRSRDFLLSQQRPDGHFCAELEGDTILESEYILLLAFMGQGQSARALAAARYLVKQQNSDGGWSNFPGGPTEISGSAKAYLSLKITGHDPAAEYMQRARSAILAAGGVEKVNSFTRYYFAMLGLITYDLCPAVPPELILQPRWSPFSIYEMSAWSRTIIVPLSLLWAYQPCRKLPPEHGIDELFANPAAGFPREIQGVNHEGASGWLNWSKIFHRLDRTIKVCERFGLKPLRRRAIRACERWVLDRQEKSDGLGAIFPPIIWTIIGLKSLGYADGAPVIQKQFDELEKLVIDDGETVRLQPCLSPVWDTAISVIALRDAGVSRKHPAIRNAIDWILSKEVRTAGDWASSHPGIEPAGWYFEYNNEFYPDVDDTCMVLIALSRCLPDGLGESWSLDLKLEDAAEKSLAVVAGRTASSMAGLRDIELALPTVESIRRGVQWLNAMQSGNGGWGAFDTDITNQVLTKVPFADHNAMLDEPTADISARVLESYAHLGISLAEPAVQKALDYVWADQEPDGAWFGRWGVNYLYGTWQVLVGLEKLGIPVSDPRIKAGARWLKGCQQASGGWGETPATYDDPSLRGTGTVTASQTAWAILGLIAAGEVHSAAVTRGVQYLIERQQIDGTWSEKEFTGTGFPRVFYLRYHFYPLYFPLMALARYRKAVER